MGVEKLQSVYIAGRYVKQGSHLRKLTIGHECCPLVTALSYLLSLYPLSPLSIWNRSDLYKCTSDSSFPFNFKRFSAPIALKIMKSIFDKIWRASVGLGVYLLLTFNSFYSAFCSSLPALLPVPQKYFFPLSPLHLLCPLTYLTLVSHRSASFTVFLFQLSQFFGSPRWIPWTFTSLWPSHSSLLSWFWLLGYLVSQPQDRIRTMSVFVHHCVHNGRQLINSCYINGLLHSSPTCHLTWPRLN